MPATNVPGSPDWWLARLEKALGARQAELKRYKDYYAGDHPLSFTTSKYRRAFGKLLRSLSDNWMALVVDAVAERLNVEGFRFGEDSSGDKDAWRIWQANQLDADSEIAHTEAIKCGESAAIVWWGADSSPEITVEDPQQVIVALEPGSRRRRAAALKCWVDEEGFRYATLYLPDYIYKYRSSKPTDSKLIAGGAVTVKWEEREIAGEAWPLPNRLEVVPVVPLVNRPRLLGGGESEIRSVIPLQDATNKLLADLVLASEFGSYPQRWATGIEVPKDPDTGQPLEPFKAAVDRLWTSRSKDTTFGQFDPADLDNYVTALTKLAQDIASQTRTPPHYFYLRGEFPSGESIKAAETGLVAKARRKMRHFGESWEEVMRLALIVDGKGERAAIVGAETIWGDPESRTEGEHVDALTKLQALGIPSEQLWEDAGYSPQQIERMKAMRAPVTPAPADEEV